MQDLHDVPDDRVWNADQTAVRMVPTSEYGWGDRGRQSSGVGNKPYIGDTRRQVTITLCACMVQSDLLGQIIYTGITAASLPPGPKSTTTATPVYAYTDGLTATCTHNHWASTPSITSLLQQMDAHINADTPEQPWILVLDVAPCHVSKETRAMMLETFAWIYVVFVAPNSTGYNQPLDLALMRIFFCLKFVSLLCLNSMCVF